MQRRELNPVEPGTLYYGDCLEVMGALEPETVDLVYLDPPFNSNATYNILFGKGNGVAAQVRAFEDTWTWDLRAEQRTQQILRSEGHPARAAISGLRSILGDCGMLSYLTYMADRLNAARRMMKSTATIYLHCDPTASHYLKLLMDAIFGARNYRNEIVWCYSGGGVPKSDFPRKHDAIFRYTKSDNYYFDGDAVRVPYDSDYEATVFAGTDTRAPGRTYTRNPKGKIVEDWWRGISRPYGDERLGYPTQKPVELLERIVKASSRTGDLVLDPFCGCGTTIAAAARLDREWVGIDISATAIDIILNERLPKLGVTAKTNGIPMDLAAARALHRDSYSDFERWAVTRVRGLVPNEIMVGDGGVDGRGRLLASPRDFDSTLLLAQVKGGASISVNDVRAFCNRVSAMDAAVGIFITMDWSPTPGARAAAAGLGTIHVGAREFPRVQFWSIADYFNSAQRQPPDLPTLADPYTGKPIQRTLYGRG